MWRHPVDAAARHLTPACWPTSVSTTLSAYTHLFDHAEHAATVIERLEARFAETLHPTQPDLPAGHQVIQIGR